MIRFGNCKTCEVLKEENRFLKEMIDRLMIKNGVAKVPVPEPEIPEVEKEEKETYGE